MSNVNVGFFIEDIPEKLYFAGKEVKFPEIYFRYAAAKNEFLPQIQKTVEQMKSTFDDKIGYLDDFVRYGVAWVKDELDPLLDFSLEQLSLNGCYGISKDDFFQRPSAAYFAFTMPTSLPSRLNNPPPEFPLLTAASIWNISKVVFSTLIFRLTAATMPLEME